jgi:hypothetical protein
VPKPQKPSDETPTKGKGVEEIILSKEQEEALDAAEAKRDKENTKAKPKATPP